MSWFLQFYRSAVGKKAMMAFTGIVLFGFVFVHMLGNLKLYQGAEKLDHYAEFLREAGTPILGRGQLLWLARLLLLAMVGFHMHAAAALTVLNRRARPVPYQYRESVGLSYASRTMRWGGVIIALFVAYHIMHLTTGWLHPDYRPGAVYHNVVAGFRVWWVSAFYIAAQLALGTHLYHGLWSMFQSYGLNHPRFNPWRRVFAASFALGVTAGNISFPLAVLGGLVK